MLNQRIRKRQPTDLYIDCVVLTSFHSEFAFLQNVFGRTGIRMRHAESLDQADFLLTVTESTVLLSDVIFVDGFWQRALSVLGDNHPLVTVLVIADPVDRPFLKDLFNRGARGIVRKPFQFEEVRRLIRVAHEASKERRSLQQEILSGRGHSGVPLRGFRSLDFSTLRERAREVPSQFRAASRNAWKSMREEPRSG
jgi:DNA-binding NtrC family response regulator